MTCEDPIWPTNQVKEIILPSNLTNLLNFIVFDILLISLVFYFTTDISGRLNYLALSDGLPKRLKISCPPIVGGGLCSTSTPRFYSLLFIRIVSFVLIFASNLSIDGRSKHDIVQKIGLRRVPGSIANFTAEELRLAVDRRLSCMTSSKGFMYFGELRDKDECTFEINLMTDPISVGMTAKLVTVNIDSCQVSNESVPDKPSLSTRTFRCKNALIQCRTGNYEFLPDLCRGVVQVNRDTHACYMFTDVQDDTWTGDCRLIQNFDFRNEGWLPGLNIIRSSLTDIIGATEIVEKAHTTLKFKGRMREVTQVHYGWFVLLGAKILLVLILACITAYLIHTGAKCVIHDEHSLASLLVSTVSRYTTPAHDHPLLYLNSATTGNKTNFWVSKYPIRGGNTKRHELEEAIVRGDT